MQKINVIAKISCYLERGVVTLKLRKEYLNSVTHTTSVLLRIKWWTVWCIERYSMSTYTGVTNCQKTVRFFGPPCTISLTYPYIKIAWRRIVFTRTWLRYVRVFAIAIPHVVCLSVCLSVGGRVWGEAVPPPQKNLKFYSWNGTFWCIFVRCKQSSKQKLIYIILLSIVKTSLCKVSN